MWVAPSVSAALSSLRIPYGRPLVLLNGSTSVGLTAMYEQATPLLQEGLARWLVARSAIAITGGTDAGIFAVLGRGLQRYGRPAACIGVTVEALVRHAGCNPEAPALEPNHTRVLLTAGQHWGDETATMYALALAYARLQCSITMVVGGGPNTIREVEVSVAQGRPLLVVAHSGGVADALLRARAGGEVEDVRLQRVAEAAKIHSVALHADPSTLWALLDRLLPA